MQPLCFLKNITYSEGKTVEFLFRFYYYVCICFQSKFTFSYWVPTVNSWDHFKEESLRYVFC